MLDNKFVAALVILMLVLINVWLFQKVEGIFKPAKDFINIVMAPVLIAGLFYYVTNPLFQYLMKKFKLRKEIALAIVFVVVIFVFILFFSFVIPVIQSEFISLVSDWPRYYDSALEKLGDFLHSPWLKSVKPQLTQFNDRITSAVSDAFNRLLSLTVTSIGSIVDILTSTAISLMTAPFIYFFLLKDQEKIMPQVTRIFPVKARQPIKEVLRSMNEKVSKYISGKLFVCLCVGIIFFAGYSLIGLKYATVLSLIAAVLNIIPYVGSFIGFMLALIIAAVTSSSMMIKALIVIVIEQVLENGIISPIVLGNNVDMHPLTILFILLTAGNLFGFLGLLIGVPAYAVIKEVVVALFKWFTANSELYDENER